MWAACKHGHRYGQRSGRWAHASTGMAWKARAIQCRDQYQAGLMVPCLAGIGSLKKKLRRRHVGLRKVAALHA